MISPRRRWHMWQHFHFEDSTPLPGGVPIQKKICTINRWYICNLHNCSYPKMSKTKFKIRPFWRKSSLKSLYTVWSKMQEKMQFFIFSRKIGKKCHFRSFLSKKLLQRPPLEFNFTQNGPLLLANIKIFYLIRMRSKIVDLHFHMY